MTRLHVLGAGGRLGSLVVRVAERSGTWRVTGSGRGDEPEKLIAESDVVLDASQADHTLDGLQMCMTHKKPFVVGTTGHSAQQVRQIRAAAAEIPVLHAPNFSVGVSLLYWLTRQVTARLADFDVEIIELHHRLKKDAPSGTAQRLAEVVAEVRQLELADTARYGRFGLTGERTPQEIGIHAVRGGDIVGEHTVLFASEGERIELTHRASSRETFARGALRASAWIVDKPPGYYQMQDVLGLHV